MLHIGRRRFSRRTALLAACAIIIAGLLAARNFGKPRHIAPLEEPGDYRVRRVVDGDTLLLVTGHRVRLIGVDTPETKHPDRPAEPLGLEASEFTRNVAEGRSVRLEFDRHRVDRYGRTLAFVWIDDLLLNEELVRRGLSRAETRFPFRSDLQKRLEAAESLAREERLGIWSLPEPDHAD